MSNLEEFVNDLSLPFEGEMTDYSYTLDLETSDDFSKVFQAVSGNRNLKCDSDSTATMDESKFVYSDGYFEVNLTANYEEDKYKVVVSER